MNNFYPNNSLLNNKWKIKDCDERQVLMISQRHNISIQLARLLNLRQIKDEEVFNFLNPNFNENLPNPFILKDMDKSINRTVKAIKHNERIGIVADYDVDGSTSAALLYKFFKVTNTYVNLKIPDRLNEGYGPNIRIMDEFVREDIDLIFTLDCGTSSFGIIDHSDYKDKDVIVIDHHMSENQLPKVFSIINPNRHDEKNLLGDLAAVGVTFLFTIGLRKKLREINFFNKEDQPNLLYNLDLVALGTVCDVVNLNKYNRNFVIKGLEILKKRNNIGISRIFDNSKMKHTPTSRDLGFILGPQLNAASRIDDSSLSSKLLVSNDLEEVDIIARKLMLLNQKRKLIEAKIFEQATEQIRKQIKQKLILVYGFNWHKGVLGIIASRITKKFNKPSIVISFNNKIGIGSARSIKNIDLGSIILSAKKQGILMSGGGHKMAAGLKININLINQFHDFLIQNFKKYEESIFEKIEFYDSKISVNEINLDLLKYIEKLEPFGQGNEEPKFIIYGINIDHFKILKEKHLMFFFSSVYNKKIRAICFNCVDTKLGENLINNKSVKYEFGCTINRNYFNGEEQPQLIIEDAMIIN